MKRIVIAFLLFIAVWAPVLSQQDPLSSQYMFNTLTFNPGVAGTSGMICATALNRQQWLGFKGAPSTTVFNVGAPFSLFKRKHGAGLVIQSDNVGFDNDLYLSGIYSYLLDLSIGRLGIGLNLGMISKSLDPTWFIPDGDLFTPPDQDPLIPVTKENFIAFDAGAGLYLLADRYYAAASVTHLNQPKIRYTKEGSEDVTTFVSRHYYLTAGYNIQLSNPSFELLPSIFAFSDGRVIQFSISSLVRYNKKVWGGVSYRAGDALIGMAGLELYNGLRIGYAYDFTLSDIRRTTSGSHELMVNYCFDISLGRSPMRYKSIRFL
ncbi:MAG TPA: type IX secretion system membrane protein PorP/SprF [Bacteroidales bacterium]|nr:type IX secretion system membrane protein PorP/SprF [Bacteroidales bacterium]HRW84005.1 type IX secretion system membrane protein PorP/SprF [Bacteroidales bacterium]